MDSNDGFVLPDKIYDVTDDRRPGRLEIVYQDREMLVLTEIKDPSKSRIRFYYGAGEFDYKEVDGDTDFIIPMAHNLSNRPVAGWYWKLCPPQKIREEVLLEIEREQQEQRETKGKSSFLRPRLRWWPKMEKKDVSEAAVFGGSMILCCALTIVAVCVAKIVSDMVF